MARFTRFCVEKIFVKNWVGGEKMTNMRYGAGTSGVAENPQGIQGDHRSPTRALGAQGTPLRGSGRTRYLTEGLSEHMVPHRGTRAIAELSRAGWGVNTKGGQLPKELADKRATANSRD